MRDIGFYLSLPWTVRVESVDEEGTQWTQMTIDELPGFVVACESRSELEVEFWGALEAYLASYLEDGEAPPLPEGYVVETPRVEYEIVQLYEPAERATEADSVPQQREDWQPAHST